MAFLRRNKPLPAQLLAVVGQTRVLARGDSSDGPVVGLADRLIYLTPDGLHELAWHDIERGGWNDQTRSLHWTGVEGTEAELVLTNPAGVPQLFRERVTATIVCTQQVSLGNSLSATISARRDLAHPESPLIWRVSPGPSTTKEQVEQDPVVGRELERLRAEYDLR